MAGGIALTIAAVGRLFETGALSDQQSARLCTNDRPYDRGRRITNVDRTCGLPFRRRKMTDTHWFGGFVLPLAARQADCSYLPDVSVFRYFISRTASEPAMTGPLHL
jgi:hypothetical protein